MGGSAIYEHTYLTYVVLSVSLYTHIYSLDCYICWQGYVGPHWIAIGFRLHSYWIPHEHTDSGCRWTMIATIVVVGR